MNSYARLSPGWHHTLPLLWIQDWDFNWQGPLQL